MNTKFTTPRESNRWNTEWSKAFEAYLAGGQKQSNHPGACPDPKSLWNTDP